ncbi:MAG: TldD/PmbA family protein [Acidobacteria bacterium]|nr:TldD/PmbA family protein [Acidobacteriota bacterium]
MLTQPECQRIFDIAWKAARSLGADDVELLFHSNEESLTRFANNAIHQNVSERGTGISVRPQAGLRTARAETNRLDAASIAAAVETAMAILRSRDEAPSLLPMAGPAPVPVIARFSQRTAAITPLQRAEAVRDVVAIARSAGQTAAGAFSVNQTADALINSRGVHCHHEQTLATFSVTMMEESSSGWAKGSAVDIGDLDPAALAADASRRAVLSRNPREIDPGRYTVILEPAAVLDLAGQMFPDFSGTAIEDQRSFLTDRMNQQVFGSNITITDDAGHPLQSGTPFDGEGVPRRTLQLVDSGVPREVGWSRSAAARHGLDPTGHGLPLPNDIGDAVMNVVIAGGSHTVDQMIRETKRGIWVTRFWYIREVDPYAKVMTGMTRDGTFLIEDGEVACGIRNFRFNQSLVEMLNNVEALGSPVRASGEEYMDMVVPAMKINGFNFTEVTRF